MNLKELYNYRKTTNVNQTNLTFNTDIDFQEFADLFNQVSDYSCECEYAERIEVHARGECEDLSMLLTKHPSENDECYQYRKNNFKPITYPAWQRAVSYSQQVIADSNWSYTASEELTSFLNNYLFDNYNFFSYFNTKVFPYIFSNPNAIVALLPFYTEDGIIYDIEMVDEENIRYVDETNGVLIYKTEKETSSLNNGETGIVFYLLNNNYFLKAVQYGDKINNTFWVSPIYLHGLDTQFWVINGGIYDNNMYKSFFDKFVIFGDEALIDYSNLQISIARTAYPVIEHQKIECDNCDKGLIKTINGNVNCHVCDGTGYKKLHHSPFQTLERPKAEYNIKDGLTHDNNYPMLNYIQPPVESLRFLYEIFEKSLKKAEMTVGLKQIDLTQSGIAKQYDNQEMYTMFANISRNYYTRMLSTFLKTLQITINYQSSEMPTIIASTYFDIQTEDELFTEYTNTVLNDTPMFIQLKSLEDYLNKKYNSDPVLLKYHKYQVTYNTLYGLSKIDKTNLVDTGKITPLVYYIDFYCEKCLNIALQQLGTTQFIDLSLPDLNTIITEIFQAVYLPTLPQPETQNNLPQ